MACEYFHCILAYKLIWCVKNDSSSSSQRDLSIFSRAVLLSSVGNKKFGWLVHRITEHLWCTRSPKWIGQELHVTRCYIKNPADFNAVIITYFWKSDTLMKCYYGFSFLMKHWFGWNPALTLRAVRGHSFKTQLRASHFHVFLQAL